VTLSLHVGMQEQGRRGRDEQRPLQRCARAHRRRLEISDLARGRRRM